MTPVLAKLFATIYPYLPYLLGSMVVASVVKSPKFKGWIGEMWVHWILRWCLDSPEYTVLRDVLLPTPAGTTQVDHIVLSPYGVFVIETKNYSGWIFGSERQPTWTAVHYRRRYSFQNPLRQNYGHLKAVETATGIPMNQLISVVVFTGSARFKTEMPENVMRLSGMCVFILDYFDPVIPQHILKEAAINLETIKATTSRSEVRNHVRGLRGRNETPKILESFAPKCPRCGAAMALRNARKGPKAGSEFYGCSNYPECRGTVSIS